ncbi:Uncharacterised protein [Mycobacteroides abscessus subsp. bolletii]|uniref:hypothetical protein n=1 Tax=Mycobacteroides abscessus TaxID=36809 RepID=UPI0009272791|nr:hypothetical protein [Mycobacteroides abscessus]SIJ89507.1 Uncharacterised protein [Mycobacteroides abscessus subsp. bolletii]SLF81259.1 Uncharacterised protein [Mycobacteroides abscessus subsp. bolletii]
MRTEFFGRTPEQWNEFVTASTELLLEHGTRIYYKQLNDAVADRTRLRSFDLEDIHERSALGHVLGKVNHRTIDDIEAVMGKRAMLSALVWLKQDTDQFGTGFYKWAVDNGLLPPGSDDDARLIFAAEQTGLAQGYCRARRRRRRA